MPLLLRVRAHLYHPLLTVGNLKSSLAHASHEEKMNHITRTGLEVTGVDLRVVDGKGNDVPRDGTTVGEIIARRAIFMDALPKTGSGKILKTELRKQFRKG